MSPEQRARQIIDQQLLKAGWEVVNRDEVIPGYASAVRESLMQGDYSDYLLYVDNKAIAVIEAKRAENALGQDVQRQAEDYCVHAESWYGQWFLGLIPLVYLANGQKIYFKNLLTPDSEYVEISKMHTPKEMVDLIGKETQFGALPRLEREGLRDCQYEAELEFEKKLRQGKRKNLAVLATGAGKTYLSCLASYRLLKYTPARRVLFLVDRNFLGRQAETEFHTFNRTESRRELNQIYTTSWLRKEKDVNSNIVISTIQKLYSVLMGQPITDMDEDAEDEKNAAEEENDVSAEVIPLGNDLRLSPDHFQLIIVDECHRSIYGRWQSVLNYFSGATILGLTATPTPEAYAFFNNNTIANYSFERSVVDGVNVSPREYRISTQVTEHGGEIAHATKVKEVARRTGKSKTYNASQSVEYGSEQLDRSVVNRDQIEEVLENYKKAIYNDLYPDREKIWGYIPKTLIFAKDDHHATEIVEAAIKVFKPEFENEQIPKNFVQKITYTAGDTDALLRDFRTEKDFRIAVTVTLVATGTDVKPLEVVLFMKDVFSDVLYTQMIGRACRAVKEEKLQEVTPNALTKECYYIVDAVGVTEHIKVIPGSKPAPKKKTLSLEQLLEHLSHGDVSDENLILLGSYCSSIHRRYEDNPLFGHHLDYFISTYGFSPRGLASDIQEANASDALKQHPFISASETNKWRMDLIDRLMSNLNARRKLLEMQKGYFLVTEEDPDELIYAGFSKEKAQSYIQNFENYLNTHKDEIEALRIIYNEENVQITHSMLIDLRDRLLAENRQFGIFFIWKNYKTLDTTGKVDELDVKHNVNALTHLIQLVRYAFNKSDRLVSLFAGFTQRFNLYCGQAQRDLTDDQKQVMRRIAEYVVNDGAVSLADLNRFDTDLWREGIQSFGPQKLAAEMLIMTQFVLKAA